MNQPMQSSAYLVLQPRKLNWLRNAASMAAALALLLGAAQVRAIEPMSSADLNRYCEAYEERPDSVDGTICVRYIHGFIAGAIATDDRVARNVAKEISGSDDFIDEFANIRYGRSAPKYGPTYFAEFCISDDVPLKEVVLKVVRDMRDPVYLREETLARNAVFRALRQDYACDASDRSD